MHDSAELSDHAERIRASGVLGRSALMQRLFDYLVECSLSGKAPKEIEVALDAFDKSAGFDVSQDAMVRVYIHKLRRKLDEYYEGPGAKESLRVVIPKGAYRFALEPVASPRKNVDLLPLAKPAAWSQSWLQGGLVASLVVSVLALFALFSGFGRSHDPQQAVRDNPVWSKIISDDRPIFIVVGDYYIFGETDDSMEITRLVREFSINSQQDLERHLKLHPELEDRYRDLELAYLPTASAFALSNVMPVLAASGKRARVTLMSDLSPAVLKSSHVIYVGYLSGLGMLQDLIFNGSRFSVGESYDELVDRKTQHRYISQAASPMRGDMKYHDYGYFSTFAGPAGNQIVIIAGTRDVAVMQTAEALTTSSSINELSRAAGNVESFEALYEVYGFDRMNLDGKLLFTSTLNTANIWSDGAYEVAATAAETRE